MKDTQKSRRIIMWNKVKELSEKGLNKSQIASELSMDRKTVNKMLRMSLDHYLEHLSEDRAKKLDPYESFIYGLLDEYPFLSSAIVEDRFKEHHQDLFDVSSKTVYNYVMHVRAKYNIDNLVNYLGNYTHRVAISNNRIIEHKNGMVTFSYKDYKAAGVRKLITLDTDEFIRRFLQHILPCGFYKVRYFGFLAMCNMKSKLSLCFDLIGKTTFLPVLQGLNALEVWRNITGKDPLCCPKCKSGMLRPMLNPVLCLKPG